MGTICRERIAGKGDLNDLQGTVFTLTDIIRIVAQV